MVSWEADLCTCETCATDTQAGCSSIDLLLQWLTRQDKNGAYANWQRYKGASKTKTGVSKKTVGTEISAYLCSHGLDREPAAVLDKINRLVSAFNKAKDWENQTGAGLRADAIEDLHESDDDGAVRQAEAEVRETSLVCMFSCFE